jgi:hypothetical protein
MKDIFKTKSIEDTEMIYSLLRDKYPKYQIEIEFNDNTKEYLLKVTDKEFKEDPEVPVEPAPGEPVPVEPPVEEKWFTP